MKKYIILTLAFLFCNASQAAVYLIDFKCEPEAYETFASLTMAELDAQFPSGSTKLARYHDLTTGSGVVLVETDDPTLVMQHVYGWIEVCEASITPVVDDEDAQEVLSR
ncbi:MAG: DUF3303 family protein [Rhodospirillales bacterium]|jgi:hypothetical protein